MNMDEEIDSLTIDALKEISNIAMGHFLKVISQLTKQEVSVSTPEAQIVNVKDASDKLGGKGTSILVGYMNVFGDATGSMVLLLAKHDAIKLTQLVLNEETTPVLFPSTIERDVLKELMTVTGGAYLSAITQFLDIQLTPTSPVISLFSAFNLLNYLKTRGDAIQAYESRKIVSVSIRYGVQSTDVKGEIIMLVGPTILDYLTKKIKER